jgi:hypothetical protein
MLHLHRHVVARGETSDERRFKEHEHEIEPSHNHGSGTCEPLSFRSQLGRTGESADAHDPHPCDWNRQPRSRSRSGAVNPAERNPRNGEALSRLDGKIDQWFSLQGRSGVAFLLNVTDPAVAHDMLEKLPLGQAHLMSFELIPLAPLNPLRQLQGITPTHP